jgi:hypothetical protein
MMSSSFSNSSFTPVHLQRLQYHLLDVLLVLHPAELLDDLPEDRVACVVVEEPLAGLRRYLLLRAVDV